VDIVRAKEILSLYRIIPDKRFGQNFLINDSMAEKIVGCAQINDLNHVIEIGPGIGALTEKILEKCQQVTLIEIDRDLLSVLKENYGGMTGVEVIPENALKVDYNGLIRGQEKKSLEQLRVISNLPYYITTPILIKLVKELHGCPIMVFTVQKEIAEKILALPGTKDYTVLSVFIRSYYQVRIVASLSPGCFYPSPKIYSSAIQMTRRQDIDSGTVVPANYLQMIQASFCHRRKTLINTLGGSGFIPGGKYALEQMLYQENISLQIRAHELTPDQFMNLSRKINLLSA
jgi:16S rRNA (adenine1518-N6/adenine1519-N6)-dimethyltransferase